MTSVNPLPPSLRKNTPPSNLGSSVGNTIPSTTSSTDALQNPQANILNTNVQPIVNSDYLNSNPLNNYMNVIYNIDFGMVDHNVINNIQTGFDNNQIYSTVGKVFPIANTGGVASTVDGVYSTDTTTNTSDDKTINPQNQSSNGNNPNIQQNSSILTNFPYYSVKKLNMTNITAPSSGNPMIGTMVEMSMVLEQPYGFTIHNDLLNLANALNYGQVNPLNYVYKISIYWSGFDNNTGQWTPTIPIKATDGNTINAISYYVNITGIEAIATSSGTSMTLSMVPSNFQAIRPEIAVSDAATITFNNTFGDFLNKLSLTMNQQKTNITRNNFTPTYNFNCPQKLKQAIFDNTNNSDFTKRVNGQPTVSISKGQDLFTLLQSALDSLKDVRDLFAPQEDMQFVTPKVQFVIRCNTVYGKNINSYTNTYQDNTYNYYIEPFMSYKKATIYQDNSNDSSSDPNYYNQQFTQEAQTQRLQNMLSYNMIARRYDYFFTGKNTEIIDFQMKYNMFYFEALSSPAKDSQQMTGMNNTQNNTAVTAVRQTKVAPVNITNTTQTATASSSVGTLIGPGASVGPANSVQNQGRNLRPASLGSNSHNDPNNDKIIYKSIFEDYLQNDMITIEHLTVRGDPYWIISPYSNNGNSQLTFMNITTNSSQDQNLFSHFAKTIMLRAYSPSQSSYLNPNPGSPAEVSTLGGFYDITQIDSEFADGKFTQNLTGYKLAHLNFIDKSAYIYPTAATNNQTIQS